MGSKEITIKISGNRPQDTRIFLNEKDISTQFYALNMIIDVKSKEMILIGKRFKEGKDGKTYLEESTGEPSKEAVNLLKLLENEEVV